MSGHQFVSILSACVIGAGCASSAHAQSMESGLESEAMSTAIEEEPAIDSTEMAETMDSAESLEEPRFEPLGESVDQMDRSATLNQSVLSAGNQFIGLVVPLESQLVDTANSALGAGFDGAVTAVGTFDHSLNDIVMSEMTTVEGLARTSEGLIAPAMDSVLRPGLVDLANNVVDAASGPLVGDVLSSNSVSDLVSVNDGNGTLIGNANSEVYNPGSSTGEGEGSGGLLSINEGNGTLLGIANYSEGDDESAGSGVSGGRGGNGGFLFSNGGGGGAGQAAN